MQGKFEKKILKNFFLIKTVKKGVKKVRLLFLTGKRTGKTEGEREISLFRFFIIEFHKTVSGVDRIAAEIRSGLESLQPFPVGMNLKIGNTGGGDIQPETIPLE